MRKIGYVFITLMIVFFLYAPFDAEFREIKKPDMDITFGEIEPDAILNTCRQNLDIQRNDNADIFRNYILDRPEWTKETDTESFDLIYNGQHELYAKGKVVWASVIQANETLFKGGKEQLPAAIVYSFDESIDSQPNLLDDISKKIYQSKTSKSSPELIAFADIISDENKIYLKIKVPNAITDEIECYFSFIMIEPDMLPKGKLSKRLLPIVAIPGEKAVLLLPDVFWDNRLQDFFK